MFNIRSNAMNESELKSKDDLIGNKRLDSMRNSVKKRL